MAIKYHPSLGSVLLCDYRTGFIAPEMVKKRPVIVISPRLKGRSDLCTVVPISTTQPHSDYKYVCQLCLRLPFPYNAPISWIKCDMLSTVALHRLTPILLGKDFEGKRCYYTDKISMEDVDKIRIAIKHALGFSV